jgi:DNA-binding transcriptional MerR regulator
MAMVGKASEPKRLYYKIGEACRLLDIQPYVLRYWETEFPQLAPSKSRSGQRVYSEAELAIIQRIKQLLYDEGFTIAGAKKKLDGELQSGSLGGKGGSRAVSVVPAARPAVAEPLPQLDTRAAEQIETLREGIDDALRQARDVLSILSRPRSPGP